MSAALIQETEIWCPQCRETVGRVMRKQTAPDVWSHVRTPKKLGPRCTRCEAVLERKR